MKPFISKRQQSVIHVIISLFLLSACIWTQNIPQTNGGLPTSGSPAGSTPGVTGGPTAGGNDGEINANLEYGPGSFDLENPTEGLAALSSYKATLLLSFDGTQDGQSMKWERTYVMLTSTEPAAHRITVDTTGIASDKSPILIAEINGVQYSLDGENKCTAAIPEAGTSLADTWEPAGFLFPVIGAEAAGSETINGIVSDQYSFDERALGEAGLSKSTGQVWVAPNEGVVVRYLLTTTAGPDYFGEGIDGTLRREYNLTDINQPVTIDLSRAGIGDGAPTTAVCPGGLVDAPLMADAQNIDRQPEMTSYSTAGSIADVLAFYQAQLPPLGWAASGEPSVSDTMGLANYIKGDQQLSLIVTNTENQVAVRLMMEAASSGYAIP